MNTRVTSPSVETLRAEQFVRPGHKPGDAATFAFIKSLTQKVMSQTYHASKIQKYELVITDFLYAASKSKSRLLAWQTLDPLFEGKEYGRSASQSVRKALINSDYLRLRQSGRRGLCAVYEAREGILDFDLKFEKSSTGSLVRVRGPGRRNGIGEKQKGRLISRKNFLPEILRIEDELGFINDLMGCYPLTSDDGRIWDDCYRQFNEGELTKGGRIYGGWQTARLRDRLGYRLDEEVVSEVDIKACFPFIANATSERSVNLGSDPYQLVKFVALESDPARNKEMREFAKLLVGTMLFQPKIPTRLPMVKKGSEGTPTHSRAHYNLPKTTKTQSFYRQISDAFPWMNGAHGAGFDLMYRESELVSTSIVLLGSLSQPIPTYPIHDSLLFPSSRREDVLSVIRSVSLQMFGAYPALEVKYLLGGEVCSEIYPSSGLNQSDLEIEPLEDWDDSEYEVIEEFDQD